WKGGPVLLFASGMAAVAAIFWGVLRPCDVVVLPADKYYTTRGLAPGDFTQMGVQVRLAPTVGNAQQQALTGAKLLWLESPSNPGLEVCDIAALADPGTPGGGLGGVGQHAAHRTGAAASDTGRGFFHGV